ENTAVVSAAADLQDVGPYRIEVGNGERYAVKSGRRRAVLDLDLAAAADDGLAAEAARRRLEKSSAVEAQRGPRCACLRRECDRQGPAIGGQRRACLAERGRGLHQEIAEAGLVILGIAAHRGPGRYDQLDRRGAPDARIGGALKAADRVTAVADGGG